MRNFFKCTIPFLLLFLILFADRSLTTNAASITPSPTATAIPMPKATVHVNYDLNYKTSSSYEDKMVFLGKKYGKLPTPKRTGYTFKGWYTGDYSEQVYNFNGFAVNGTYWKGGVWRGAGDKDFVAKWQANTYTVSFDANGGTVNTAS